MIRGALAIFTRDFKKFMSNPLVIFMTLFMPIMYLVIFGNAMGGTITHIPIGVVQDEPYITSPSLFVAGTDALKTIAQRDSGRTFDVTVYNSEQKAKDELSTGKIKGVIVFPSAIEADSAVRVYVDSSDYVTPSLIEAGTRSALAQAGARNPIAVNKIYGDIKYIQFFGVGVIVMAIFMTTMFGGGIALIKDREVGIVEGYLVTPVKRSSIILGMIGSGTVRAFFAGLVIFLMDLLITGISIQGPRDFLLILLVLFITSMGVTSLMVSIASRFTNQQEYSSVTAFFSLILFMTSGAFYPTIGMPDWLRWITVINPEYYAVDALRSIILRGQGLEVIGMDIAALLIFTVASIALGIATFRRTLE
ncbi:MAG: ABC transporter permease [Methanomicrobiales archaeon]|nr:ABC transporter permease [Methanomicrobiales archaeon]